ncbi:hypothetical protein HacjB3_17006 (plasmid) [Halalkalicoccus jeotgali B3]|uniref:Uncharacterized protein n=1 Tax=Halalkalicoccus jeotgali (strain DSM 18796 / CECT 7217 / JCM 14584 / KCTC 4019 / B3) TaxID=795797 RepID=D8JBU8_HALJB|nr:hypothetical protein HacjB3_17006 [Halalkalicoccus jeotgali B3]
MRHEEFFVILVSFDGRFEIFNHLYKFIPLCLEFIDSISPRH